ncbi:MAG: hypothetical protein ACU4EQ_01910 [Candidatus Nitrosoglobus sp.]|jgi:hypothetical protein
MLSAQNKSIFLGASLETLLEKIINFFKDNLFTPIPLWILLALLIAIGVGIFIVFRLRYRRSPHLKIGFSSTVFRRHLIHAKEIYILNTFAPNFNNELKEILLEALNNRILIKVLLWNPNCGEVNHRQKTLPERNIQDDINQNIEFLQHIYNEAESYSKSLLQLKLYNSWSPFSLYATDQGASVGFFMNGMLAVEGTQLVITKNTHYFNEFIEQFEKIWETGKLFNLPMNDWRRVLATDFFT